MNTQEEMNTRMLPCSLSRAPFDFSAYTEQGLAPCLGNGAAHSELDLPTSNYLKIVSTDTCTGKLVLDHPSWRCSSQRPPYWVKLTGLTITGITSHSANQAR